MRASLCIAAACLGLAHGAELLVSLDARDFRPGDGEWRQTGEDTGIPRAFEAHGSPVAMELGGAPAVVFDGDGDYFRGPATTAALHAPGAPHTVEVWVRQGDIRPQESVVSWSRRSGEDGQFAGFRYGSHPEFGAVARWLSASLGFEHPPEAGRWHHLAYVYDGRVQRVYVDGALQASKEFGEVDAHDSLPILLGAEQRGDFTLEGNFCHYSGALGRVRIHAGVLEAGEIERVYQAEKKDFPGARPVDLAAAPRHRYRFNVKGAVEDGTRVEDVIGAADAVVCGSGAEGDGAGLRLPGGSSAMAAYVDLPNGLVSEHRSLTLEFWAAHSAGNSWGRLISAGTTTVGEVATPGGDFYGSEVLALTSDVGSAPLQQLIRTLGDAPDAKRSRQTSAYPPEDHDRLFHHVLLYDAGCRHWLWFRDGALMESLPDAEGPAGLHDVNIWLGRSEFSEDANLKGRFDELRIYDYALSPSEIEGNRLAGPDELKVAEPDDGGA